MRYGQHHPGKKNHALGTSQTINPPIHTAQNSDMCTDFVPRARGKALDFFLPPTNQTQARTPHGLYSHLTISLKMPSSCNDTTMPTSRCSAALEIGRFKITLKLPLWTRLDADLAGFERSGRRDFAARPELALNITNHPRRCHLQLSTFPFSRSSPSASPYSPSCRSDLELLPRAMSSKNLSRKQHQPQKRVNRDETMRCNLRLQEAKPIMGT